ncbi:DNA helicase UvrD [archaeon]|nr:DNA helicase UvrD [archaeon]
MRIISDLHIHSRFSRACSKQITIPNLEKWARVKGVNLLGTGDFTHPLWLKELKNELTFDNGVLKTKSGFPFILQSEISLIYSQDGKGRRIHNVFLAPNFEVVDQIVEKLLKIGRIDYDGRPIFGISCVEFVEMMRGISKDIEVIPAHIWTPWFSLFGSKSGFDKIEDCFKDQTKYIHALETGLSSDPEMNRRVSSLDKYNLVSFSDMHSFWPWRIGREATIFDTELNYDKIINAIRTKEGLKGTIEVDPSYGKYHFDGHRACDVSLDPKDSIKKNNICPKCGKGLTIGVLHRVEELADREKGPEDYFKTLIPLSELISSYVGTSVSSKKVEQIHIKLMNLFKSEFNVLLDVSYEDLKKAVDEKLAELIIKNRENKLEVIPGYDGEYGKLDLEEKKQKSLSEF